MKLASTSTFSMMIIFAYQNQNVIQMRLKLLIIFLFCFLVHSKTPDQFTIDLDTPPIHRYTTLATIKATSIAKFIKYLYTQPKYHKSFRIAKNLGSFLLKTIVGHQFYDQCRSVAIGAKLAVSQIVVFNYMYELGAYNDFCTSIAIQDPKNQQFFLARNLDYGYQEYLAENTVQLTFLKNGKKIVGSIGHAGLIGVHTGMRFGRYSATLNERIDGGLHLTLQQIFITRSETIPYLLRKTLLTIDNLEDARQHLIHTRSASPVYYILNGEGRNILIQKQRNGIKGVYQNDDFLVQTNTDRELPDPDTRRTVAQNKVIALKERENICQQTIWKILCQSPNKNPLTLITAILDTKNQQIHAQVWVQ